MTGDQGAFQVAALVSFKSAYSRVTMRKYLPVGEGGVGADSKLTSGVQALVAAFGDTLMANMTATSGRAYRFGYKSPTIGFWVLPRSRAVSLIAATQRRRRPGVGS
jgi:hypothetical protein